MENQSHPIKSQLGISAPFLTFSLEIHVEPQESGYFCFCFLENFDLLW